MGWKGVGLSLVCESFVPSPVRLVLQFRLLLNLLLHSWHLVTFCYSLDSFTSLCSSSATMDRLIIRLLPSVGILNSSLPFGLLLLSLARRIPVPYFPFPPLFCSFVEELSLCHIFSLPVSLLCFSVYWEVLLVVSHLYHLLPLPPVYFFSVPCFYIFILGNPFSFYFASYPLFICIFPSLSHRSLELFYS